MPHITPQKILKQFYYKNADAINWSIALSVVVGILKFTEELNFL
jgi:hypothetical protein